MLELGSLYSGSSGNCILVGNGNAHVLIDAGVSGKKIEAGLNGYGLKGNEISALLITHEHSDHIMAVGIMSRRYGLPIYATKGTIEAIKNNNSMGKIDDDLFHVITPDTDFMVEDMVIHPIRVSHDAVDPVAYRISCENNSVAVMTDLGVYDDYIIDNISGLDAILLESNHDIRMLQTGSYTYPLKVRIMSDYGHLSNESSGRLLSKILHDNIKHIFLGHLSHENNLPDLAYETVRTEIDLADNQYRSIDFNIEVAHRDHPTKLIKVG